MSGLSRRDSYWLSDPSEDDPTPVECDGTCNCSGDGPCRWYGGQEKCGYPFQNAADNQAHIVACYRCEGSGMHEPERAEWDPT